MPLPLSQPLPQSLPSTRARAKTKRHGKAFNGAAAKPPRTKRSIKNARPSELYKWKLIHAEDVAGGAKPNEIHLDNLEKAKRAFDEFDKKGKAMVEAAEAFFKANEDAEACRHRRVQLELDTQRRHAAAILRHAVLTEEYNDKVAIRKEARRKANEASC